jgi:rhamnulokinase
MLGSNLPPMIAIDLGAESCRVSFLQWNDGIPEVEPIHRFSNAPMQRGNSLHWNLPHILAEIESGLLRCASRTTSPIYSIGVDGWAADYVRLNDSGQPIGLPFCYRDKRTLAVEEQLLQRYTCEQLYSCTGVQPMRVNTAFQLKADQEDGVPSHFPWITLPEYVLTRLGGVAVAEYTNVTHTGMVDCRTRTWSTEVLDIFGLDAVSRPLILPTGGDVGLVDGKFRSSAAFRGTRLIAPACHDTASAVAGIVSCEADSAYISSGTWSLVGTLLRSPVITPRAYEAGFTNLGATGSNVCFHKNVTGMWLLKQTLSQLCSSEQTWSIEQIVRASEEIPDAGYVLEVDDPQFMQPAAMASCINAQLLRRDIPTLPLNAEAIPKYASLIFRSLAARYANILSDLETITGKKFKRIHIVGGGSLNGFVNSLTEQATGIPVCRGAVESATLGNFAIQLAAFEDRLEAPDRISYWAHRLSGCATK